MEGIVPVTMALSGSAVPGVGFLMVPGRSQPLMKGADDSLALPGEDGREPRVVAKRDQMREALGLILDDDERLLAAYESQAVFDSGSELPKGVMELLKSPRFWGERALFGGGFVEAAYLTSVGISLDGGVFEPFGR
jgi:hypothetical protein